MRIIFILFFALIVNPLLAQYQQYARKVVDTLTTEYFWGRGYTNNGLDRAANYIAQELNTYGLKPMDGKSFFQTYSHPVNRFPGKMKLEINGKLLIPGKDFIVAPESVALHTSGKLVAADSVTFIDQENRFILQLKDKLTWSVSTTVADYTAVDVKTSSLKKAPTKFKVDIDQVLDVDFKAANVAAILKGSKYPDSLIMFTAHYDHLGGMGADTYFPGANDNASGVSLLLSLAKYYSANPPEFSVAFICFASEEAGLIGSKYYTENPLIPLNQIRFLWNTDLAGTGDDGITVVNATEFPNEFELLKNINNEQQLLKQINARGKAANSDHYFFTEKGVPSFFFYTLGGSPAYHDVEDVANNISLSEIDDLVQLITRFNEKLMQP